MSYYDKGAILGSAARSGNSQTKQRKQVARRRDAVPYAEFFKKNRNYRPADFQKACELMAGSSLDDFFAKYVRGHKSSITTRPCRPLVCGLTRVAQVKVVNLSFGADTMQENDRLMVRRVYAGSPAYDQGLNAGDQIVALDNMRVCERLFQTRMAEKKPGDLRST